tara:strand:- start:5 stop:754 length:750 start_codon:yes stop_codon:yes gene_type:complete
MKFYPFILLFIIHLNSVAQDNGIEIEADYEIQGYFKNFTDFDIDSLLMKKFTHITKVNEFHTKEMLQRNIDFGLTENIYNVNILYSEKEPRLKTKSYKVNVYKENDSIIGLINYEPYRNKVNFYFDFEKLAKVIDKHNSFYNVKSDYSDFINESMINTKFDYVINENNEIEILDSKLVYFKSDVNFKQVYSKWLKSYNIDFQNYGVKSLEYLSEKKKIELTVEEKKLIKYINKRNSASLNPHWIRYWEL